MVRTSKEEGHHRAHAPAESGFFREMPMRRILVWSIFLCFFTQALPSFLLALAGYSTPRLHAVMDTVTFVIIGFCVLCVAVSVSRERWLFWLVVVGTAIGSISEVMFLVRGFAEDRTLAPILLKTTYDAIENFTFDTGVLLLCLGFFISFLEMGEARRRLHAERQRLTEEIDRRIALENIARFEKHLLEGLMNAIPDSIYFKDRSHRFIRTNRFLTEWFGLDNPESLIGKTDRDIFTTEHASEAEADEKKVMETNVPIVGKEERETWPDGRSTWVLTTKAPLTNMDGAIVGVMGISRDITERKRVENQLRESDRLLREILDNTTDVAYKLNLHTQQYEYIGAACLRQFGYLPEELMQIGFHGITERLHPDDRAVRSLESNESEDAVEQVRTVEYRVLNKEGVYRWVSDRYTILSGEDGKPNSTIGIIRDITDQRQMEDLSSIQRELAMALGAERSMPEALRLCVDAAMRVGSMDAGALYLVDRNTGDLRLMYYRGLSDWYIRTHAGYASDSRTVQMIMEGKPTYLTEGDVGVMDNEILHEEQLLSLAMIPIQHERHVIGSLNLAYHRYVQIAPPLRHAVESIAAQVGGVLARIEAEEALASSEERYRTIIEASSDAILLCAATGLVLDCNTTACTSLEFDRSEVSDYTLYQLLDDPHGEDLESLLVTVPMGGGIMIESEAKTRGGTRYPAEVVIRPAQYGGDRIYVVYIRDISERKRGEDERAKLQTQVLHAQKSESLGALAGGVAHDFNNLLMGVLANANMVLSSVPESSPLRPLVEQIESAADRAADLARQMLAYAGRGRFVVESLNINELIKSIAILIESTVSKKALVEFSLAKSLPQLEGDPAQFRQVIINLITNASDALGDDTGVIRVSTGAKWIDEAGIVSHHLYGSIVPGFYVVLEVSDTGAGMEAATAERLFDPFFTTKFTGRGLGLPAVFGIVRGHKGAIEVVTAPGQGSTFRVYLPPPASASSAPAEAPVRSRSLDVLGGWVPKGAALVVDDEDSVRSVTTLMLEKIGYDRVYTATNGRAGVETFRNHKDEISLIIMDITMPEMSGDEAFRQIHQSRTDIPVVFTSGYDEQEALRNVAGIGMTIFLHKPYRPAELARAIYTICVPSAE